MRMQQHGVAVVCLSAVVAIAALSLGGCSGETPSDELWNFALSIDEQQQDQLQFAAQQGGPQQMQRAHQMAATALERALQQHAEAPEELRQVLQQILEGERKLANGEVSGSEAEALREEHEQLWTHLRQRELPPSQGDA